MEPPSTFLSTGCVPWQGLLLIALLVTIWNIPTAAESTIESMPSIALEGKDILLLVHNLPKNLVTYHWYRGKSSLEKDRIITYIIKSQEIRPGKLHSGREIIHPNGSLMIQNVTLNDAGFYNLNTYDMEYKHKIMFGQVFIYPLLSKPSIRSSNSSAVEGKGTVELTCEPHFWKTSYLWRLNGNNLPDGDNHRLSHGNRTLTLLKVTRHFKGHYECEARNPMGVNHSESFTLNVFYGPDSPKIFPPDTYFEEGTNLWLSCETISHPKAHYSWNVNGKPWSSTQEVFITKVTTSNNGLYTCLVDNPTTGLSSATVKEITVIEKLPKPQIHVSNKTVREHDFVDLICNSKSNGISIWWVFNNERLQATKRMKFTWNNRRLTIDPISREDAGTYQCKVSNPFISRMSDPIHLAVIYQPQQRSTRMSTEAVAGMTVETLAALAVLGGLVYFLYFKKLGRQKVRLRKEKRKKKRKGEQKKDKKRKHSHREETNTVHPQSGNP